MEHVMRIAFWIFTFSVTLSGCYPVNLNEYNIELMKQQVECQNDSEFYTPNPTEIKCFKSALECIYKELNGTARTECEDPNHRIDQGLESLEIKIDNLNLTTNLPECTCELWTQTSFSKFLDNYESLLQRENAAAGK